MRKTSLLQAASRTYNISDQIKEQIPNAILYGHFKIFGGDLAEKVYKQGVFFSRNWN